MAKSKTKQTLAAHRFVPGSSRTPRSAATLLLQMAKAAEQQQEVADRIRTLRGPVPQPRIAEQVGVTLRAYQEWEAGGGIAWHNYGRLAAVFGVTEEYLLYGAEGERPNPGNQIDRVEAKLDALLRHFDIVVPSAEPQLDPREDAARAAEEAGQAHAERRSQADSGTRRQALTGQDR